MRRFQQVAIDEPSVDEALKILQMLKEGYEEFHQVKYDDDALELAVTGSARHITDRYLPDKAIDLIDEAGAWVQMNRKPGEDNRVDKALIANVLARIAKVEALTMDEEDNDRLESLEPRILDNIYGQDEWHRCCSSDLPVSARPRWHACWRVNWAWNSCAST